MTSRSSTRPDRRGPRGTLAGLIALSLVLPAGAGAAQAAEAGPAAGIPARAPAATSVVAPAAVAQASVALPTAARPARPSVRIMPGNKMVTISWVKVPRATKYVIQYSTSKAFPKSRTKTVTTTSVLRRITRLTNRTTYYVRVKAVAGSASSAWTVRSARPSTDTPGPRVEGVKITPAGVNRMKVTWKAPRTAEKFWIVASFRSDGVDPARTSASYRFTTASYPATATSATVTIPASFRSKIGAGAGNAVFVNVYVKNADKTRRSPLAIGWPGAVAPTGTSTQNLRFATYNVLSIPASENMAGRTWAQRRTKVAATIAKAAPDVVGVQELNLTWWFNGTRQVRHYEDLAALLKSSGYAMADPVSQLQTLGANEAKDAHIFYRTSRVEVLDSGLQSVRALNTTTQWVNAKGAVETDRYLSWAKMRSKASGAVFFVATLHLPLGTAAANDAARLGAMRGVEKFMSAKAGSYPVVILGDFNSYLWGTTNGPDTYLVSQGWQSAAATTSRSGYQYPTSNSGQGVSFPAKPYVNPLKVVGYRIDHIFSKNASGSRRYVNQVLLTPSGIFDPAYQGSDHNLQYAILSIRN